MDQQIPDRGDCQPEIIPRIRSKQYMKQTTLFSPLPIIDQIRHNPELPIWILSLSLLTLSLAVYANRTGDLTIDRGLVTLTNLRTEASRTSEPPPNRADQAVNSTDQIKNRPLVANQRIATFVYLISAIWLAISIIVSLWRRAPRSPRAIPGILLSMVTIVLASTCLLHDARFFPERSERLWQREVLHDFQPAAGKSFIVRRRLEAERMAQVFNNATLLEDGRPLPTAATPTGPAEQAGQFSVLRDTVTFSTIDGSDPRTNGRSYILYSPPGSYLVNAAILILSIFNGLLLIAGLLIRPRAGGGRLQLLAIAPLLAAQLYVVPVFGLHDRLQTWRYLRDFDVARIEANGTSFCLHESDSKITPERFGEIRRRLAGVTRSEALREIFARVTAGAVTDTQRHLRLAAFLQKAAVHTAAPPTYPNELEIFDPLFVLEAGEMWCNQASTLAIDLFEAGGYRGRQVQLGGHVAAEIHYEGAWHYFDADLFGNGEIVLKDDGRIPAVAEMAQLQLTRRLDALAAYQESLAESCAQTGPSAGAANSGTLRYPSFYYFSSQAYGNGQANPAGYYLKVGPTILADLDIFNYGWIGSRFEADPSIITGDFPLRYTPSKPFIEEVSIDSDRGRIHLAFRSTDPDQDLAKYRIFVSESSRGWAYNQFYGRADLRRYKANIGQLSPENYERLFQLPPAELGLIEVPGDESTAEIDLHGHERVFVSIMPVDSYGERAGRKVFPLSNELKIDM